MQLDLSQFQLVCKFIRDFKFINFMFVLFDSFGDHKNKI